MKVSDLMSTNIISVTPEQSVASAARLLQRHNIGSLPVCSDEGKLRGIVTDRDIVLRCVAGENDPEETKIKEIMTRGVVTVSPGDDVAEATRVMALEQVRRLPVVEQSRVVGILSLGDMATKDIFDMEASRALAEISSAPRRF